MPESPNIVFICSDQHSYRYTGFAGHPDVETPNLDRIAESGVVFENAYCSAPSCTPSRASLMTGVYPSDVESYCNATVWNGTQPTWGTRLRNVGYRTWATGKLELDPAQKIGFEGPDTHHPHATGPDITALFRRPLCYRPGNQSLADGDTRSKRHQDVEIAKNAEQFLREEAPDEGNPWAAWIGFSQPHPPFQAKEAYFQEYYPTRVQPPNIPSGHLDDQHPVVKQLRHYKGGNGVSQDRIRRARAGYYGMVTELDEYVGRVYDSLEAAGELQNTVFVYTSDHGEMLGAHGLWSKNTLYEDSVHVPLVLAGSGLPENTRVETPVGHVDLIRTLLEWAGADTPNENRGRPLDPLYEENGADLRAPNYVYAENHTQGNCTGSYMIRKGPWKYIHFTWYDDLLFDLSADPYEFENLIDDSAVADIRAQLEQHLRNEVNPTAVTREAFETQEEMLRQLGENRGAEGLFETLRGRLGDGQARALADKHT